MSQPNLFGPGGAGLAVGDRYLTPPQVAVIRAQNLAKPPGQPADVRSLRPISERDALFMRLADRGSGVIDPTRTATDPATVQRLREQFSDSGVSGYRALSVMLGKNLAGYAPGVQAPIGWHPSLVKAIFDTVADVPAARGAEAAYLGARVLRAGLGVGPALGRAQAAMHEWGPVALLQARAAERLARGRAPVRVLGKVVRPPSPPIGVRAPDNRSLILGLGRASRSQTPEIKKWADE